MNRLLTALFLVSGLSVPAYAQEADEAASPEIQGIELGARLGYGIPIGDAAKDSPLSDMVSGQVPIIIDAGYRFNKNIYAGAYFQYGFAFLADDACPEGIDCSSSNMRLGINADYHFMPDATWNPWVGLGLGYEWLTLSAEDIDVTTTGFEFVNISAGADFKISKNFSVGPFVTFTAGQYSESEIDGGEASLSADIEDKTIHDWLILGVRGRFNL